MSDDLVLCGGHHVISSEAEGRVETKVTFSLTAAFFYRHQAILEDVADGVRLVPGLMDIA